MMRRWIWSGVLFAVAAASAMAIGACKKDEEQESICRGYCGNLTCRADYSEAAFEGCVDTCKGWYEDAPKMGEICSAALDTGIRCFEELDCDAAISWLDREVNPGDPYPCQEETEAFEGVCSGIWIAP